MKNLYKIFGILSALFSVQAVAQEGAHVKKSYTTYDLFYMDNNHGANAIGLNDSLIEKMAQDVRKLLKQGEAGFLLFRSNGDRAQVTERKEDILLLSFGMEFSSRTLRSQIFWKIKSGSAKNCTIPSVSSVTN